MARDFLDQLIRIEIEKTRGDWQHLMAIHTETKTAELIAASQRVLQEANELLARVDQQLAGR